MWCSCSQTLSDVRGGIQYVENIKEHALHVVSPSNRYDDLSAEIRMENYSSVLIFPWECDINTWIWWQQHGFPSIAVDLSVPLFSSSAIPILFFQTPSLFDKSGRKLRPYCGLEKFLQARKRNKKFFRNLSVFVYIPDGHYSNPRE